MVSSISLDLPVHFLTDWTIMYLGIEGVRMMDGQAKADTKCHAEKGLLVPEMVAWVRQTSLKNLPFRVFSFHKETEMVVKAEKDKSCKFKSKRNS